MRVRQKVKKGEKAILKCLVGVLVGGVVQGRVDRLYTRRSSHEEGFTRAAATAAAVYKPVLYLPNY